MLQRPGLSRADLLIALFLALAGAGLVLAAVARMREAADTAACRLSLKQLSVAVHNYCDSHRRRLPPLTDQGDGAPTGGGLPSVFATLIPFIEAGPKLYDPGKSPPAAYHAHSSVAFTYRHKDDTTGTAYGGVANQVWRVFVDPADGTGNRLQDVPMPLPDGTTGYYAAGSYAVNGLLAWGAGGLPQPSADGTANTVLIAERPQVCRGPAGETVYNLWGLGFYSPHLPAFAALTPAEPPGLWPTGQVAPARPLPGEGAADRDARIRVRVGRQDAEAEPPDFATPVQVIRGGRACDPRLPATSHRAGMQTALADGSVRVFAPDTSPWVFWAACLPAGPEVDGN